MKLKVKTDGNKNIKGIGIVAHGKKELQKALERLKEMVKPEGPLRLK